MDNPLHAGRRPILRWTVRMRLDTSGESNPAVNRKAVCKVRFGACADRSFSSKIIMVTGCRVWQGRSAILVVVGSRHGNS